MADDSEYYDEWPIQPDEDAEADQAWEEQIWRDYDVPLPTLEELRRAPETEGDCGDH